MQPGDRYPSCSSIKFIPSILFCVKFTHVYSTIYFHGTSKSQLPLYWRVYVFRCNIKPELRVDSPFLDKAFKLLSSTSYWSVVRWSVCYIIMSMLLLFLKKNFIKPPGESNQGGPSWVLGIRVCCVRRNEEWPKTNNSGASMKMTLKCEND